MGSSSSKASIDTSKGASGNNWQNTLEFHSEAGTDRNCIVTIPHNALIQMFQLLNPNADKKYIKRVYKCTTEKTDGNIGTHSYVVFKTDDWWWSIEKNFKCIKLKRTIDENEAKKDSRGRDVTIDPFKHANDHTVMGLIRMLHAEEYLHKSYNVATRNCNDFTSDIIRVLSAPMKDEYKRQPRPDDIRTVQPFIVIDT